MKWITLLVTVVCSTALAEDCILPELTHRGDVNLSGGEPNLTDAILIDEYLQGKYSLPCFESADVDNDGDVDETDRDLLLAYLFEGCNFCISDPHCIDCDAD